MTNNLPCIDLSSTIPTHLAGFRLDQALAELFPEYSRSRLQNWIRNRFVLVNGCSLKQRDLVYGGEKINILANLEQQDRWQPQAIDLDIVYEDQALLILNKPPGLVTHPGAGNHAGTLANALLHHRPKLTHLPRAGIVHRLDKDTSGLLVVAKTLSVHTHLIKQLQNRTVKREYEALVVGHLITGNTIIAPIGRHPTQRTRMAITHFRILEHFRNYTRIKVTLETGRTHQIRVHLAAWRYPLLGDPVYGHHLQLPVGANPALIVTLRQFKRQALHAKTLGLLHPDTHEPMEWTAPIATDMQRLIHCLRENNPS